MDLASVNDACVLFVCRWLRLWGCVCVQCMNGCGPLTLEVLCFIYKFVQTWNQVVSVDCSWLNKSGPFVCELP